MLVLVIKLTSLEVSAALETFKERSSLVWGKDRLNRGKQSIFVHLLNDLKSQYLCVKPCQKGSEVEPSKWKLIYADTCSQNDFFKSKIN